ncbi:MAG TPA: hypothetical protein P5194_03025 [Patescibacteria group bacterium]|jgi:uncharacterized membrane protein|nr:hypothetical protein [Patescibacteria group bacterium]
MILNPKLHKQASFTLTANVNTKQLLQVIYRTQHSQVKDTSDQPKIKVSSVISRMAFFYEKIRNVVEYKEEYLLRKEAIKRILRRKTVIEGDTKECQAAEISEHLLTELIRGGYLPNNQLPLSLIDEVAVIIKKYLVIKNIAAPSISKEISKDLTKRDLREIRDEIAKHNQLVDWLLAVAASEIEARLSQDPVLNQAIKNLYEYLSKNIQLADQQELAKDLPIQIYLSINRNFAKLDDDMLTFILFKYYIADWQNLPENLWPTVAKNIEKIRNVVNSQLRHPLAEPLDKIISRYAVAVSVSLELLRQDPVGIYTSFKTDPQAFSRQIKKICETKYTKAKKLLWRAAVRSIIYIFITKGVLVILLEIPANKIFGAEIEPLALLFNILFPPTLLFFSVLVTKVPDENNTEKIIKLVNELSFEEYKRSEPIILRVSQKKTSVLRKIFNFFYGLAFIITFGAIIWLLTIFHFTWVSILIFLFFLVFVSFFIIRIKKVTNELKITEEKENLWRTIFDFFSLPVLSVGKYLSEKFSKINVFVFFLDFIIETPFKFLVNMVEDWTNYVNERKNQIG